MLANLRRKVGGIPTTIPPNAPPVPTPSFAENMIVSPSYAPDPSLPPPLTMEELGFSWPNDGSIFSPAAIPPWLQEQVQHLALDWFKTILSDQRVLLEQSLNDLGLPANGSEGIFLQAKGSNGWSGDFPPMPEAW